MAAAACSSSGSHPARRRADPPGSSGSSTTTASTAAPTTTTTLPPGPLAPVVSHVKTTAPVVFITIDDGYTRDPRVIGLVQFLHIPITAFVTRTPAGAGRAFWQALQAAGASIEDHTITHPNLRRLTLTDQEHEVCGLLDDYSRLFGKRPTLFRPPYGDYNAATRWVTASCGLRAVVLWRATMLDGHLAIQGGRFRPGDIILLHWRPTLYDDLVHLLTLLNAQHFTIGRLDTSLTAADLVPAPAGNEPSVAGD
jgi:peptidoglycan/xylan/chitin deacetylase (PgdA/CDA1 family)